MENFQEDLTKFLIKLKGAVPVGTPWWGFDIKSKPLGVQLYQGQILSRDAYPVHWSYVQQKKTIVTDQEWLEYSEAHNGFCPYFSYGDNTNTYRMPKIVDVHPKFVYWGDDVGSYVEPGLPNITGTWEMNGLTDNGYVGVATGAFDIYITTQPNNADGFSAGNPKGISFNANKCSSIYGASNTVQPPAINMLIGEYVISSVGDFSLTTEETIQANIETLELELSKYLSESELNTILNKYNTSYVIEHWANGLEWYRVWSNGWIEQGGKLTPTSGGQDVTLYKEYSTNTYGVQATNCDSANYGGAQGWAVSTTVVRIRATSGTSASSTPVTWYAYGF